MKKSYTVINFADYNLHGGHSNTIHNNGNGGGPSNVLQPEVERLRETKPSSTPSPLHIAFSAHPEKAGCHNVTGMKLKIIFIID